MGPCDGWTWKAIDNNLWQGVACCFNPSWKSVYFWINRFQREYLIVSIKQLKFPTTKHYIVVLYREEHSKNHRPQHHNNHGQLQERKLPFKFFFLSSFVLLANATATEKDPLREVPFHWSNGAVSVMAALKINCAQWQEINITTFRLGTNFR